MVAADAFTMVVNAVPFLSFCFMIVIVIFHNIYIKYFYFQAVLNFFPEKNSCKAVKFVLLFNKNLCYCLINN